jgi:protein gp37
MFLLRSQEARMADVTAIEWTDATWNPVTGCTKISAGCDHCYAERFSERFRGTPNHPFENGFDLTLRPERLEHPLRWRGSRMIFVNSMSDLFHKEIPPTFIEHVFDTMERANWHTFQVLTKRSSLMRDFLRKRYGLGRGPTHMWFGVSVEDGTRLSRIRHLREAPAGVRFLSIEPLIGPVGKLDLSGIDWVIVGGESGPGARPMKAEWVRDIRDQCHTSGVAFFFKQWGGLRPKSGGRELDGREWSDFPKPVLPCAMAAE